jgi:hypothetical protein
VRGGPDGFVKKPGRQYKQVLLLPLLLLPIAKSCKAPHNDKYKKTRCDLRLTNHKLQQRAQPKMRRRTACCACSRRLLSRQMMDD